MLATLGGLIASAVRTCHVDGSSPLHALRQAIAIEQARCFTVAALGGIGLFLAVECQPPRRRAQRIVSPAAASDASTQIL